MYIVWQGDNKNLDSQIHSYITAVGSGEGREMNHDIAVMSFTYCSKEL